jgi:hypothetical protein
MHAWLAPQSILPPSSGRGPPTRHSRRFVAAQILVREDPESLLETTNDGLLLHLCTLPRKLDAAGRTKTIPRPVFVSE